MRGLVAVFTVLCVVVVSLDGGVLASPTTTGGESNEETRTCPMSAEADETSRFSQLVNNTGKCVEFSRFKQLEDMTTLEEFHQFFNTFCQDIHVYKKCFSERLDEAKLCVNQTHQMFIESLIGMFETGLNVGCDNNGETFAKIYFGMFTYDCPEHIMMQCERKIHISRAGNTTILPREKLTKVYHELTEMKECFHENFAKNEELKTLVIHFMDEVMRALRCINHEDNTLVLCSSIKNN